MVPPKAFFRLQCDLWDTATVLRGVLSSLGLRCWRLFFGRPIAEVSAVACPRIWGLALANAGPFFSSGGPTLLNSSSHNRRDSNRAADEGLGEARLIRLPIGGRYSGGHLDIGTRFSVGNSPVIRNGNRGVRIIGFNSIDKMIRPEPVPEGSRLCLPKAGKYAIKPADSLRKCYRSHCFECRFPDQVCRIAVLLDGASPSGRKRKRFAPPITRLYDFTNSESRTPDVEKIWHVALCHRMCAQERASAEADASGGDCATLPLTISSNPSAPPAYTSASCPIRADYVFRASPMCS